MPCAMNSSVFDDANIGYVEQANTHISWKVRTEITLNYAENIQKYIICSLHTEKQLLLQTV